MSHFTESENQAHYNLVVSLVRYLEGQGWTVTHADGVIGYQKPVKVKSHIPDVMAVNPQSNLVAYGEAETCETLASAQTIQQIDEFSNRVMTDTDQRVPLFVLVPQRCFSELQNVVRGRFPGRSNITLLYLPAA